MLWDEPKIFFLERRYFFSIILSEFLKNRVALQWEKYALVNGDKDKKTILFQKFKHVCRFILEAGHSGLYFIGEIIETYIV